MTKSKLVALSRTVAKRLAELDMKDDEDFGDDPSVLCGFYHHGIIICVADIDGSRKFLAIGPDGPCGKLVTELFKLYGNQKTKT